jgi:hypothetical protein
MGHVGQDPVSAEPGEFQVRSFIFNHDRVRFSEHRCHTLIHEWQHAICAPCEIDRGWTSIAHPKNLRGEAICRPAFTLTLQHGDGNAITAHRTKCRRTAYHQALDRIHHGVNVATLKVLKH